jgi:hypothetical protein
MAQKIMKMILLVNEPTQAKQFKIYKNHDFRVIFFIFIKNWPNFGKNAKNHRTLTFVCEQDFKKCVQQLKRNKKDKA